MKTIKSIIISALTLITVTSCHTKVRVNTVINEDGTCSREVIYDKAVSKTDIEKYNKGLISDTAAAPIPNNICVDGMEKGNTTANKDTLTITFRKDYASVEEMPMPILINGKALKSKPSFEKKFKWFFTEYTYTETFETLKEKLPIPLEQIAGKDTLRYMFTGSPDILGKNITGIEATEKLEAIKDKFEKWIDDCVTKLVFTAIADQYDSIKNAPLTKDEFINSCDSFKSFIIHSGKHYFDCISSKTAEEAFKDFYKTDAYSIFFDDNNPCSEMVNSKVIEFMSLSDWKVPYTIQMPGEISEGTDITIIDEKTGLFIINGDKLLIDDYTLSITSRKTNAWAFVVTGLIILIAIASFIYGRKKK